MFVRIHDLPIDADGEYEIDNNHEHLVLYGLNTID
jgi:hypothetical protein